MSQNTDNQEEPEAKRLRSSEPDLLITVGTGDDCKEYHYHSQVMATYSSYVDTMLASPMKESESLTLSFPDITPDVWDLMMKVLNPAHARNVSVENAMKLAPVYDKYDFKNGTKVCDDVLADILKRNCGKARNCKPKDDMDTMVDAFVIAREANLQRTMKYGAKFFSGLLTCPYWSRYGPVVLTLEQVKKLQPLIVEKRLLRRQHESEGRQSGWTDEEILNPLFPDLFLLANKNEATAHELRAAVIGLRLTGTNCKADGEFDIDSFYPFPLFESNREVLWSNGMTGTGRTSYTIFIGQLMDDWVIYGETHSQDGEPGNDEIKRKIMWRNPLSDNLPLPPKTGWEAVDKLARGKPKIEYLYPTSQRSYDDSSSSDSESSDSN